MRNILGKQNILGIAERWHLRLMSLLVFACLLGPANAQVGVQMEGPSLASSLLTPDSGGGIKVARRDVLFGNPSSCSAPAEVDLAEALRHTPEGRQIEDEGIQKGTARYSILAKRGLARIRQAIRKVAVAKGNDCVVKAGSIVRKPEDMTVSDLTDAVIEELE